MKADQTKVEFYSWLDHPLTKTVRRLIERSIDEKRGELGRGATINTGSADNTSALTNRVVGMIQGLEEAHDIFHALTEEYDGE